MRLPGGDRAQISRDKIVRYLLLPAHPTGGGKANFFLQRGFRRERPGELEAVLRAAAVDGRVSETVRTDHGTKYVVDAVITTADGRRARLRTVWIVLEGENCPRLITAYPTLSLWKSE